MPSPGTMPRRYSPCEQEILRDFQQIPGVGPRLSEGFPGIGLRSTDELRGADPEDLYGRMCEAAGGNLDRCVLYVCRCAVYWASAHGYDPELLKWWNWKDRRQGGRTGG